MTRQRLGRQRQREPWGQRQQHRHRNRNIGLIGQTVLFVTLTVYWSTTLIYSCSARDCHTSFRRAWRDLSCQEQDDFLAAIIQIKNSGAYDEFIAVHLGVAQFTHGPAEFLPWHRYVLMVGFGIYIMLLTRCGITMHHLYSVGLSHSLLAPTYFFVRLWVIVFRITNCCLL